jgi:hypothetical protein
LCKQNHYLEYGITQRKKCYNNRCRKRNRQSDCHQLWLIEGVHVGLISRTEQGPSGAKRGPEKDIRSSEHPFAVEDIADIQAVNAAVRGSIQKRTGQY